MAEDDDSPLLARIARSIAAAKGGARPVLQIDPAAQGFLASGPGASARAVSGRTPAERLAPRMQEHRQALIKSANDPGYLANYAQQNGLADEDIKFLIHDNYSSPRLRTQMYNDYLGAKNGGSGSAP